MKHITSNNTELLNKLTKKIEDFLFKVKRGFLNTIKDKVEKISETKLQKEMNDKIDEFFYSDVRFAKKSMSKIINKLNFDFNKINISNLNECIFKFKKITCDYNNILDSLLLNLNKTSIDRFKYIIGKYIITQSLNEFIKNYNLKRKDKIDELYKKMDLIAKMTKGIESFQNIFGRFWDLSIHDLHELDLSFIRELEYLMKNNSFIPKIAELIGRLASKNKEYEENIIKEYIFTPSKKYLSYSPSNIVGVTIGSEISSVLSHQLGLRNIDEQKILFNKLFTEKQLIMFDLKDKNLEKIEVNKIQRIIKKDSLGPIIIVIDTSGSMHGEPETLAKAFALALIKIANKDNRRCFIISFSTATIDFEVTNLSSSWKRLYKFLSQTFSGGTDINPAVKVAIKKVNEKEYKNADVIFISDMIINEFESKHIEEIKKAKKRNVRFHSLTIGNSENKLTTRYFDSNWVYDGSQESIEHIIYDLNKALDIKQK
ncbi:VWA domain-containing protein [Mycoplasma sp. Mirounga ES2805-ORL]|uniref:VWA domain-containing protein n=1 Tax=Mycoplasma sp. Mirounga ES2805-ORL TaxID=754514 RepID=UPI00197BDBEA|nr:VWA domain-containing protein [Mycoplasma sp. Mirounga ES2805-ORL]QSF13921.1 VWA domain-containing protein [Mycoplasma sp. Mirounga ES2805-ORL]